MSVNEYGIKGVFGSPSVLKVNGTALQVVCNEYSGNESAEKIEGKDEKGEVIGVATFNPTQSVTISGWIKKEYLTDVNKLVAGVGFTLEVDGNENFYISEGVDETRSSGALATFSISATRYPKIDAPVAP